MDLGKTFHISAAHFVHLQGGKCTHLHGHNWNITIYARGPIRDDGMIVDFGKMKKLINDVYDHKTIIPLCLLQTAEMMGVDPMNLDPTVYYVHFMGPGNMMKRYMFPKEDVIVVNQPTTTSEHLVLDMVVRLKKVFGEDIKFRVEIEETPGSIVEGGDYIG